MRAVAQFEAKVEAERFGAVLYAQGIENRVDKNNKGSHTVWVFEEEQLETAQHAFEIYSTSPNDPRIHKALKEAEKRAQQEKAAARREKKQSRHKHVNARKLKRGIGGMGPLTFLLVAACVIVYILIEAVEMQSVANFLYFAKRPGFASLMKLDPWAATEGEVWRFITPAFMHASAKASWMMLLHIVFNMMWLKDLGTIIERFHSAWLLLGLVLLSAAASNTLQYMMQGPFFVGMSGVVYALLGFLWIRGTLDPWVGYRVPNQTVVFMLAWFAFGWFDFLPGIKFANWAHAGGLIVGVAWGLISSMFRQKPQAQ